LQKHFADAKNFALSKVETFTEDESESYARMLSDGTD
jgi:hypothetical protein